VRKFVLLLGCFAASPAAAGDAGLSGEAIKTTLSGSLLALDTPVGSTVSVRVGHDGIVTGDAGSGLGAVLGASKDRGRWWIVHDQVCFKWFRWFDAEEHCAAISVTGNRLTWRRDDGDTGTATIVEQGRSPAKAPVIVAEAKKADAPAHKLADKKPEVVAAAKMPAAEAPRNPEPKLPVFPAKLSIATQPAVQHSERVQEAALHVPAPQLVVRPKSHDKVAVASVKPQFFTSKSGTPKARPAKVEVAKLDVAKGQTSKSAAHKPFRVAGVDPRDVLNIRTGPSSEYQSVGTMAPDSRGITMTGPCQNDWCPVKHQTLVGWVNRRYLTEETAANTAAVDEPNYWDPTP
jgi:Bacterial SH3 domain